ncbi:AT-rich interactive domain-containing protein 3B, partial [Pseudolycoriella hygida]
MSNNLNMAHDRSNGLRSNPCGGRKGDYPLSDRDSDLGDDSLMSQMHSDREDETMDSESIDESVNCQNDSRLPQNQNIALNAAIPRVPSPIMRHMMGMNPPMVRDIRDQVGSSMFSSQESPFPSLKSVNAQYGAMVPTLNGFQLENLSRQSPLEYPNFQQNNSHPREAARDNSTPREPSASPPQWSMEEQHKQLKQQGIRSPVLDDDGNNVEDIVSNQDRFRKNLYDIDADPGRRKFLDSLFAFHAANATKKAADGKKRDPITRLPIMAKQVLDLYKLYTLVIARGGLVEVIIKKLWQEIIKGLNLPSSITSAAFTLRTQYVRFIFDYEMEVHNLSTKAELDAAIDGNKRESRKNHNSMNESPRLLHNGHEMLNGHAHNGHQMNPAYTLSNYPITALLNTSFQSQLRHQITQDYRPAIDPSVLAAYISRLHNPESMYSNEALAAYVKNNILNMQVNADAIAAAFVASTQQPSEPQRNI